jgi:hypothetical protein
LGGLAGLNGLVLVVVLVWSRATARSGDLRDLCIATRPFQDRTIGWNSQIEEHCFTHYKGRQKNYSSRSSDNVDGDDDDDNDNDGGHLRATAARTMPSPMALNKHSPTPSMFKKSSNSSLLTSASSYLTAVSEADARARTNARTPPPTATPALSLSSSITSSSEDTVLEESDCERGPNALTLPHRPPTSEQVFTTVHAEFGHCDNETHRYTSRHAHGTPVKGHVEQDPPYYILLATYISYLILICLGHLRDFVGKRLHRSAYRHLIPHNVSLPFPFVLFRLHER